ncbi:MAG: iron-containing alcohol dehydrogenase [Rhodobacterales bacterium]|nr:iron-containing alcohol dehydrogenase [Rhodobacterales bacterium]
MTLITYPTRVHFADGVLEEALRSELDRQGHRTPLLLAETDLTGSAFHDRVLSGLPRRADCATVGIAPLAASGAVVDAVLAQHSKTPVDVIVAFGSARAISMARECRRALSDGKIDLYAIPGVDGLPDPGSSSVESWRMGLPSILICDPTVTLGADRRISQAASVLSLARCLESYLALSFNPPADGMALDGFRRCIRNIHRLSDADAIEVRRDLMAASLNAMMAQEKGIGPAQILARALGQGHSLKPGRDTGAIARLILPGVLAVLSPEGDRPAALCALMGGAGPLAEGMRDFLADLPLDGRLSDLGIDAEDMDRAILALDGRADIVPGAARAVLEAVL